MGEKWRKRVSRLGDSNPRPHHYELRVSAQICGFLPQLRTDFANLFAFDYPLFPIPCTVEHIGRQRDWYSRAALTNNATGVRYG